jgi:hypothetical protein
MLCVNVTVITGGDKRNVCLIIHYLCSDLMQISIFTLDEILGNNFVEPHHFLEVSVLKKYFHLEEVFFSTVNDVSFLFIK